MSKARALYPSELRREIYYSTVARGLDKVRASSPCDRRLSLTLPFFDLLEFLLGIRLRRLNQAIEMVQIRAAAASLDASFLAAYKPATLQRSNSTLHCSRGNTTCYGDDHFRSM